ncbi:MAG: thioredoxin domain-containing protein [Planctomycetes bacterium]|nr:thioredoxin domain-containing protein [Planctomycetota bacterium]
MKRNKADSISHVNSLINASSPYLLQHAHSPINWREWGVEAFEKAWTQNKPILLSLGYSASQWCRRMQEETFSCEDIAAAINCNFIAIKVDRDERPDVDNVYRSAVSRMNGSAGWPLTVFLTPQLKPFFGGSYYSAKGKEDGQGFRSILNRVIEMWNNNRDAIESAASAVVEEINEQNGIEAVGKNRKIGIRMLNAGRKLARTKADNENGGFGSGPKFPHPEILLFLLAEYRRTGDKSALRMVEKSLRKMHESALFDQLAGGFHRYVQDAKWLRPHFEKMLPDNAMLARVYAMAYKITGKREYANVARQTVEFIIRELASKEGAFYSSISAGDENDEDEAYYTWSMQDLTSVLGHKSAEVFAKAYGVTHAGNYVAGRSVLFQACAIDKIAGEEGLSLTDCEIELVLSRNILLKEREKRGAPFVDKKIITAWNGLAIGAIAYVGSVLDDNKFILAARNAANWILNHHRRERKLARYSIDEKNIGSAFLEDYAALSNGLLDLYSSTLRDYYIFAANDLAEEMYMKFIENNGVSHYTDPESRRIIELPAQADIISDSIVPSPLGMAMETLGRLKDIRQAEAFSIAEKLTESAIAEELGKEPGASFYSLYVASFNQTNRINIVLVGPAEAKATRDLAKEARKNLEPGMSLLWASPGEAGRLMRKLSPLLQDRFLENGKPTLYMLKGNRSLPPITEVNSLKDVMKR